MDGSESDSASWGKYRGIRGLFLSIYHCHTILGERQGVRVGEVMGWARGLEHGRFSVLSDFVRL